MAKAPLETIARLEAALNDAADRLQGTTSKKMFGCHALWVDDRIYALV